MFHLFLPQMRMSVDSIVERAQAAETAGFEGIAFMDHLAPPLAEEHDMWEAITIAGWVLANTSTLVAGHLVLFDALRHPSVLARQVATLDHASGGRFELGIGWGSVPQELAPYGFETPAARDRVTRLGESLAIMKALWTGEAVDFDGEFFQLRGARQRPATTRAIPITIGGTGPRTLELVREHAHWWNVPIHQIDRLDEMRPAAGNAQVTVQQTVCLLHDESQRAEATATIARRFGATPMGREMVIGTTDELADHFCRQRDRGVARHYLWFSDFAPADTLARFGDVIAAVGG